MENLTGSRSEVNYDYRDCFQIKSDVFDEDIHIHELAHGIHLVGGPIIKGYSNALLKSYKWAMGAGTGLFNTFFKPSKMKVFYENRY